MRLAVLLLSCFSLVSRGSLAQAVDGPLAPEGASSSSSVDNTASSAAIRIAPPPPPANEHVYTRRPLHDLSTTLAINTLGGAFQVATPLSSRFEIRTGINFLAVGYPMNIDGMDFHARFHWQSSQATIDWFPVRADGFHISPGVFYFHNSVDGATSVGPGQSFTLGNAQYLSSIDDPVNGSGTITYSRKLVPMLNVGFTDLTPRKGHISIPIEAGVALTGDAKATLQLNGTACNTQGCFSFNSNAVAVSDLAQQVAKINHYLSKVPVYPIFSIGVTYHF